MRATTLALLTFNAAILGTTMAQSERVPCDPQLVTQTIYKDPECKEIDEALTKDAKYVPKENYYLYTGQCTAQKPDSGFSTDGVNRNYSTIFQCSADGFHWGFFNDKECKTPGDTKNFDKNGWITFKWGGCTSFYGIYTKVVTSQKFTIDMEGNKIDVSDDKVSVDVDGNKIDVSDDKVSADVDGNKLDADTKGEKMKAEIGGNKMEGQMGKGPSGNMTWSNWSMEGDGYKIESYQGMDGGEQYQKSIQMFDKQFYYGIDHMGAEPGSTINSCKVSNECTQKYATHCCVNVHMVDGNGKENSVYRCMNQRIADANMAMTIEGVKFSMKCVDSSAMTKLSLTIATTLGLAMMALY